MRVGDHLGPYRLLEEVGAGATGRVFLAEEEGAAGESAARVALKVFHPHLVAFASFLARFEREAAAGRRVEHENVVRVFDAEMLLVGGTPCFFLVMEAVEGRTLRRIAADLGPLPEPLLREVALQAARGLAAIHAQGLVHRDVKPDNLVLTKDGRLRITDLGVARLMEATRELTDAGDFVGTVLYAAPEVLGGERATPAADLYALGVTLHELASGRNVFARGSAGATVRAHADLEPPHLADLRPDLSPFLGALVAHLLRKSPGGRLPSAEALVRILEQAEASAWWAEQEVEAAREARRRRNRPFLARESSMLGRADDLAALCGHWERARSGIGCAVWLEGEAGIGKSRLVDAFLDAVGEEGRVLYASYPPTGAESAVARSLAPVAPPAGRPLAERLGTLAALGPAVEAAVHGLPVPSGAPSLTAEGRFGAFARLLASLAAERPLVWVVEDLHFAQPEERALLRRLARETAGRPALLLVTSRPGLAEDAAAWGQVPGAFRRSVVRLSPREVILVLRELVGSESLAERLGGRIAFASDGVPYFLLEIVRGLREGNFLSVTPDGTWIQTKDVDHVHVPPSLREVLRARLADLSREERALLDVAAVAGFEFDPAAVAAVLDRRLVAVLQTLAVIERRTGLVRAGSTTTRFDHHLVQELLYADLPERLRRETHALLADFLDAEAASPSARLVERCRHHLLGSRPERVRALILPALDQVGRSASYDVLDDLASRALGQPGLLEGHERLAVLDDAMTAAHVRGRPADAERIGAELVDVARALADPLALAKALGAHAYGLQLTSRLDEALVCYQQAVAVLTDHGAPVDVIARARTSVASGLSWLGRTEEARRELEETAASVSDEADAVHVQIALIAFSILGRLGHWKEADETALAGITRAERCGEDLSASRAHGQRVTLLAATGRYEEARASALRALGLARAHANTGYEAGALLLVAGLDWWTGDLEAATEGAQQAIALAESSGGYEALLGARLLRATLLAWHGDVPGARAILAEVHAAPEMRAGNLLRHGLDRTELSFACLAGEPRAALADVRRVAEDVPAPSNRMLAAVRDLALAETAALAGEGGPADVARARSVEAFSRPLPWPGYVWRAVAVRALLGDASAGELKAARTACEDRTAWPERLRIHYLTWKATADPAAFERARQALAHVRGAGDGPDPLPFLRELRA